MITKSKFLMAESIDEFFKLNVKKNLFDKNLLNKTINITNRVKTYEDACEVLGINPINDDQFKANGFKESEISSRKLETIAKALNEDWEPDWDNKSQIKYYPRFDLSGGFAFGSACSDYYSYTDAGSGSRFCFKSKELAEYAGKQFIDLYKLAMK